MLRFFAFASAAVALSLAPSLASASTVVTKPGGFATVAEDRLAFSTNKVRTVAFEQLRLEPASGEIAWLVAVPRGATVELGHPAFFASLDQATAPVLTPATELRCGVDSVSTVEAHDEAPPGKPLGIVVVSGSEAASALGMAGYTVDATVRAQLLAVEKAGERVAILELRASVTTPLIRVIGPSGRPMPTALLAAPLAPIRGYAIAEQRVKLASGSTFALEFERIRWDDKGISYSSLLDETMMAASDGIVVTFASSRGLLTRQPSIPSVAERYLGDDACVDRALASASSSAVVVSTTPGSGELASATFSCGTREDLAAAMIGLTPASTWITRFEAVDSSIAGALAADGNVDLASPHRVTLGGCTPPRTPGDPGTPSNPGTPSGPAQDPSSGGDDQTGNAAATVAADACIMGLDSCSKSSSSDSSSDGCGGDSSSSGDGCGGGSSSSSSGCGGSSSGSGDSCSSGPHTSSADDGCRIGFRPRRVRLSPIALGLVAVATILRRRTRRAV